MLGWCGQFQDDKLQDIKWMGIGQGQDMVAAQYQKIINCVIRRKGRKCILICTLTGLSSQQGSTALSLRAELVIEMGIFR